MLFLWSASTLYGSVERGMIDEKTKETAKESLSQEGFFRIELKSLSSADISQPLTNKKLLLFIEDLKLLLQSGISLHDSIRFLIQESKQPSLTYIYISLLNALHSGKKISQAFRQVEQKFPEFFCRIISFCDQMGNIEETLELLAQYYGDFEKRKKAVLNLTRYPLLVFLLTSFLILIVLFFVIPLFSGLYGVLGDELPFITQVYIAFSYGVREYLVLIIIIFLFVIGLSRFPYGLKYNPFIKGLKRIHALYYRFYDPMAFCQSMSILLENGVDTDQAVQIATQTMSKHNQHHGEKLYLHLHSGASFKNSVIAVSWFPNILITFLSPAEESGNLALGFHQSYLYLARYWEAKITFWSQFLGPALTLFAAILIGTTLLAVYIPIFNLGDLLQ